MKTAGSSRPTRKLSVAILDAVLAMAGIAAVVSLALEYGFRHPPVNVHWLHAAEATIVAVFVLDRLLRLWLAPGKAAKPSRRRLEYLRENWIDFVLIAALVAVAILGWRGVIAGRILSAGALYVIITQAYLLIALALRGVGLNIRFAGSGIHPTWLLVCSFLFMILIGTGLLMLPVATPANHPITFTDAAFTATSATCVTGLVVRDTGAGFTAFGQGVILALIQLGGLGIMIFGTMLAILVGRRISMRSSSTLGHMIATADSSGIGQIRRSIIFILVVTVVLEALGALGYYPMFSRLNPPSGPYTTAQAAWHSIFHSISSFCNAGFALYRRSMMAGVDSGWDRPLRDHWQVMGLMPALIVLGGLGFPVLQDCARWGRNKIRRGARILLDGRGGRRSAPTRLSLHTKIVLWATVILIVAGALGLMLLEPSADADQRVGLHKISVEYGGGGEDFSRMPLYQRLPHLLFQSITARTAGFNTIDMNRFSDAGKLWMCGLMVIGGSPASTAGGMKTATFVLVMLMVFSVVRQRNETEAFSRSIPFELLRRAVTVAVMYLSLVAVVTLLLCVAMRGHAFISLLFEACSACGTVGLSTGVTSRLNIFGKYVIVAGMFIGRLGPLTLVLALTSRIRRVQYAYPSESVVIG